MAITFPVSPVSVGPFTASGTNIAIAGQTDPPDAGDLGEHPRSQLRHYCQSRRGGRRGVWAAGLSSYSRRGHVPLTISTTSLPNRRIEGRDIDRTDRKWWKPTVCLEAGGRIGDAFPLEGSGSIDGGD